MASSSGGGWSADQQHIARADYRFDRPIQGEVALDVGDVVLVQRQLDNQWSEGRVLSTGAEGRFPSSFVSRLSLPSRLSGQERLSVAVQPFASAHPGDLPLDKGAVVVVSRAVDDNWLEGAQLGPNGRVTSQRGIFPKSFVVYIDLTALRRASITEGGGAGPQSARVVADLQAKLEGEVDLRKGEVVTVLDDSAEWCMVQTNDGRRGTCPRPFLNFETPAAAAAAAPNSSLHSVTAPLPLPPRNQLPSRSSPLPVAAITPLPQYANDFLEPYARTKFPFHGEYSGELSFAAGRIVKLLRHVDDEWLQGELDGKVGIFPASYVDTVIDCPSAGDSVFALSSSDDSSFSLDSVGVEEERTVAFDYLSREKGDLSAFAGDVVVIVRQVNAEWAECRSKITGAKGIIPVAFLAAVKHVEESAKEPSAPIKWRFFPGEDQQQTSYSSSYYNESSLSQPPMQILPPTPISSGGSSSRPRWNAPYSLDSAVSFSFSSSSPSPQLPQPIAEEQHFAANVPVFTPEVRNKPAAPPLPTTAPTRLSATTLADEREHKEKERAERLHLARERIAQDLVKSEIQFVADLHACDRAIRADTSTRLDKNVLLAGYPEVIALAARLLSALEDEYAKIESQRAFGCLFMRFKADFSRVYGKYGESADAAVALMEKYDQDASMKDVLRACLKRMQAEGCSCIDVHSAITRPVQRVLKYPLFLGELLKSTDLTNPDHPKLLEAVKQMSSLAQSLNEQKRQKDIVLKYRKEQEQSLGDRLSKINLHTMRKKSSRFGLRLRSSIGITHLERDETFDAVEAEFRATDRLVRTLIRDVQLYCDRIQHQIVQQVAVADAWKDAFGLGTYERLSPYRSAWIRCIEVLLPSFYECLNNRVRKPLECLLRLFDGPCKLIAKRLDKLMDYEAVKSGIDDKRPMNENERIKKGEYEALNGQLKAELPELVAHSQNICRSVQEAMFRAQQHFYADVRHAFDQIFLGTQSTRRGIAEKFETKYMAAFEQLRGLAAVSIASKPAISAQKSAAEPSKKISMESPPRTENGSKTKPSQRFKIAFPTRRQTDADRDSLRRKYAADQLFTVVSDAAVVDAQLDLIVGRDDVVVALIKKDPMGNDYRWYCDNGLSKGFVAKDRLRALSSSSSAAAEVPTKMKPRRPALPQLASVDAHSSRTTLSASLIDFASPPSHTAGDRRSYAEELQGLDFGRPMPTPPAVVVRTPPQQQPIPYFRPASTTAASPAATIAPLPPRMPLPAPIAPSELRWRTAADPFQELWIEAKKQPITVQAKPRPTVPTRPEQPIPGRTEQKPQQMMATNINQSTTATNSTATTVASHRPVPSMPIRPAPPPPPPTTVETTALTGQETVKEEEEEGGSDTEFFVAEFSFDATDPDNQLSLSEGQVVAVHVKHDQSGNIDWWLVEDDIGGVGYVPANYLKPYT